MFAPTNAAFGKLPAGTVDTLVKPENKAALTKILTYHVVAGKLEASDLTDGKMLKTVEGEQLTVKKADGKTWIVDAKGDTATITITERQPIERRHPRDRHRAAAGVLTISPLASRGNPARGLCDRQIGLAGRRCLGGDDPFWQ